MKIYGNIYLKPAILSLYLTAASIGMKSEKDKSYYAFITLGHELSNKAEETIHFQITSHVLPKSLETSISDYSQL